MAGLPPDSDVRCAPQATLPGEHFFLRKGITAVGNILVVSKDSLFEKTSAVVGQSHRIVGVFDNEKALDLISNEHFDLLIAEAKGGFDLVEAVRRREPTIALVLIGNQRDIAASLKTPESGPQSFLMEPFSLNELGRAIEDVLERSRLLRDNKRLKALLPLFEISKTLMSESELGKFFDAILEIVWKVTEADSVSLMLVDEASGEEEQGRIGHA